MAGLAGGLLITFVVGQMMLGNNNQGEFADVISGEWTGYFWVMLALVAAIATIIVTLFLSIIGLLRQPDD